MDGHPTLVEGVDRIPPTGRLTVDLPLTGWSLLTPPPADTDLTQENADMLLFQIESRGVV
jgi:hypothetical protein